MTVNLTPQIIYVPNIPASSVGEFIRRHATSIKPQLLLCFLTTANSSFYAPIKVRFFFPHPSLLSNTESFPPHRSPLQLLGDVSVGVASQCMVSAKAVKGGPQYFANCATKINVKLGGVNTIVPLPAVEKPTVIFGIDVSHASPGSAAPSVAAVVASMNSSVCLILSFLSRTALY
jgi:hypothetical protein